jgi:hypothetical protein
MIMNDASMLKIISIHKEEEEEAYVYIGGDCNDVEFETSDDFNVYVSGFIDSDVDNVEAETSFSFDVVVGDAAINMCNDNKDNEEEEDQDYILYDHEGLFINDAKNNWINSLLGDGSSDKTIYGASDLENEWNISSDDDDDDDDGDIYNTRYKKSKSYSSEEFIDENNINISKK